MNLSSTLAIVGLAVLVVGRLHPLLRVTDAGGHNLPTPASFWLRLGSVLLTIVLWLASLIAFAMQPR